MQCHRPHRENKDLINSCPLPDLGISAVQASAFDMPDHLTSLQVERGSLQISAPLLRLSLPALALPSLGGQQPLEHLDLQGFLRASQPSALCLRPSLL